MTVSNNDIAKAEAHLYVGIAKADGLVTQKEYAQMPYYADKEHRFFDKRPLEEKKASRIGKYIREILVTPAHKGWTSDDHLEEAAKILVQARNEGHWSAKLVMFKNQKGFLDAAKIDGYVVKEAKFIRKMEALLGEDSEHLGD